MEIDPMMEIILFVVSGMLIGISISLIFFRMATKQQLKEIKLKAMASMYHEILLKRRNDAYKYSEDAEAAVKAVTIHNILGESAN